MGWSFHVDRTKVPHLFLIQSILNEHIFRRLLLIYKSISFFFFWSIFYKLHNFQRFSFVECNKSFFSKRTIVADTNFYFPARKKATERYFMGTAKWKVFIRHFLLGFIEARYVGVFFSPPASVFHYFWREKNSTEVIFCRIIGFFTPCLTSCSLQWTP